MEARGQNKPYSGPSSQQLLHGIQVESKSGQRFA